jgi:hypothetical protein
LAESVRERTYLLDTAVIVLPAGYEEGSSDPIRQAAGQAGFEVLEILTAQDAAAVFSSWAQGRGQPDAGHADAVARPEGVGAAVKGAMHGKT